MPIYEVEMSRVVLVRQTATEVVEAPNAEEAFEVAGDQVTRWTDTKVINSEGYEVEDVRELLG